jgi:hypothetical protein
LLIFSAHAFFYFIPLCIAYEFFSTL